VNALQQITQALNDGAVEPIPKVRQPRPERRPESLLLCLGVPEGGIDVTDVTVQDAHLCRGPDDHGAELRVDGVAYRAE
jgi:hypothetical protein